MCVVHVFTVGKTGMATKTNSKESGGWGVYSIVGWCYLCRSRVAAVWPDPFWVVGPIKFDYYSNSWGPRCKMGPAKLDLLSTCKVLYCMLGNLNMTHTSFLVAFQITTGGNISPTIIAVSMSMVRRLCVKVSH